MFADFNIHRLLLSLTSAELNIFRVQYLQNSISVEFNISKIWSLDTRKKEKKKNHIHFLLNCDFVSKDKAGLVKHEISKQEK